MGKNISSSLTDLVLVSNDFVLEDAIKEVIASILNRSNPHLQLGQEYIIFADLVLVSDDSILEDAIKEVTVALILDRSHPHLQLGQE